MTMKIIYRDLVGDTSAERAGRSLVLASFLSAVGFNFIFPLLPLYMYDLSGPGPAAAFWAGLAMAATPLAGALVSPLWGRLADRFGYRPMLLRALVCTTVALALMALPQAPWQLVALRALAGGLGSFQPAAMGALTSWSRPEDLSRAVSRLQMAQVFGSIVGPLIGGVVASILGMRAAPVAGGLAIGLGILLVARWFHEPVSRRTPLRGANVPLRPTVLWLPMLTLVAVQFTDSSFNPILPLLLTEHEGDAVNVAGLVGFAASSSATAAAVGAGLVGRGFKQGAGYRVVVGGSALLGGVALVAVLAPLPWGLVALRVLCGGIVGGLATAALSIGGLAALPGQRGSAYGWLHSSSMMGFAASPIVAGAMAAIDLRAVLPLDALLCLMAAASWGWSRAAVSVPVPPRAAEPHSQPSPPADAPGAAPAGAEDAG